MFMNLWEKDSPLNDVRVRKALSLAINRQELASALIPGFGKLASCHTADVVFTEERCRPLPYDPAQAKALLADYLTDHPNANLELRVPSFPRQGFPEQHLANQAIAEYWKAIGVKTKIERVDFGTFYSQDWLPKKCSRCAPVLAVVQQPFTQGILEAFTHSEGSLSYVGDMDPELDRLLENTRLATTIEEYANWYFQANDRIEHEKFYHTGLFDADAVWAYDPKKHERWPMGTSFGDIGLRNLVTRAAQ
jgi:ABC-type transport system substrate-binding protein